MIKKIIGLGFIILGLLVSYFNSSLCVGICENCSKEQLSPCFFLLLFVGIIFIISGLSLILTSKIRKNKKKNLKNTTTTLKLLVTTF